MSVCDLPKCACVPLFLLFTSCSPDGTPERAPDQDDIPRGELPVPMAPPDAVGGFHIDLPPVTLMPGEEKLPCYVFPLEVEGPSRIVSAAVLQTGPGMHHGNITTRRKTGEGMRTCDGAEHVALDIAFGGAVLFASSTQVAGTEWQRFPDGMGYRVREGYEIVARMHYINPQSRPVSVSARYRWYTIDEGAVTQELGPFAWTYSKFEIPPLREHTVRTECRFEKPMHIVNVLPHMHGLGRRIAAGFLGGARDGRWFLDEGGYGSRGESDIRQYRPAVDLSQGEGVRFLCTWQNTFDKVIREGVGDNEMCIVFGYAYPKENAYSAMGLAEDDCIAVAPPPIRP